MLKNKLVGFAATTPNLKLQSLDPVYTRLLNKNIDITQIKKVNSEKKIIHAAGRKEEKNLKNRVLDITKLNKNLNIFSGTHPAISQKINNGYGTVNRQPTGTLGLPTPRETNSLVSLVLNKNKKEINTIVGLKTNLSSGWPLGTVNRQPGHGLPTTGTHLSPKNQNKSLLWRKRQESKILDFKISKYLKTITEFEPEIAQYKNIVYNFNSNKKQFKLNSILENSFYSMKSLIGTPVFEITPNKLIINLFYYLKKRRNNFKNLTGRIKQLQHLCVNLSKKINKPIELDLIKLHHPTLDSKISANAIGIIANKLRKPFRVIASKFFRFSRIKNPTLIKNIFRKTNTNNLSFITGIRLKLGGRLITQKVIPRRSSKTIQKGNLNRCNTDIVTTSRFTAKSKRGAFSITVSMGHKFF